VGKSNVGDWGEGRGGEGDKAEGEAGRGLVGFDGEDPWCMRSRVWGDDVDVADDGNFMN
jgi:hypothetical protein